VTEHIPEIPRCEIDVNDERRFLGQRPSWTSSNPVDDGDWYSVRFVPCCMGRAHNPETDCSCEGVEWLTVAMLARRGVRRIFDFAALETDFGDPMEFHIVGKPAPTDNAELDFVSTDSVRLSDGTLWPSIETLERLRVSLLYGDGPSTLERREAATALRAFEKLLTGPNARKRFEELRKAVRP
jgi:hypothetical protein